MQRVRHVSMIHKHDIQASQQSKIETDRGLEARAVKDHLRGRAAHGRQDLGRLCQGTDGMHLWVKKDRSKGSH